MKDPVPVLPGRGDQRGEVGGGHDEPAGGQLTGLRHSLTGGQVHCVLAILNL